jgi:hypothetical protein
MRRKIKQKGGELYGIPVGKGKEFSTLLRAEIY